MLEYITVDKLGIDIRKILFFLLKVQGKTKLLTGRRCFKSRWLFCYGDFKIFHFFSIFRLFTIFIIFSDIGMVFSGKFYMENIFLGIFLTKFEAGIAKNQNFGDNIFFLNEIFIITWNLGSWKIFWVIFSGLCGKNFSQFGRGCRGRVYNFAHLTWNYSFETQKILKTLFHVFFHEEWNDANAPNCIKRNYSRKIVVSCRADKDL